MKNTTYGDEINKTQVNTSALELLTSEDKVSANSINRPLQNIFEDEEASYLLLQNLIKNIYGNKDGSLPNILEEFKEPRLIIDQNNTFIRIPFGVLNIKQKTDKDNGMSYGLAYSGEEDPDSIAKKITNHKFINDGYDSYTIINKPKLGLAKRQMADFINLDINDLDNDIKIYSKTFNSADEVSKLSKVGEDYYTPIFKIDEGTAKLKQATLSELNFPFTSYYFSVVQNSTRATNNSVYIPDTEQVNFPNKEEATSWYFANISGDAVAAETINIYFTENGENQSSLLPEIEFSMKGTTTIEEQYSNIVSDINLSYSDYYSAEITSIEYSGKVYSAVKIVSNINYNSFTNNTKMVVYASGSTQPGTSENQWVEDDGWYFGKNTPTFIMKTNMAKEQEYYYDSLSVLYGLFSKYSSYVINENVSKNEFALEELININDIANGELIVYLNTDFNDKYLSSSGSRNEKHLSSSKMFGCDTISNFVDISNAATIEREKPIALFKITVSNKQITSIVNGKLNITRSDNDYIVSQDPSNVIEVLDPGKLSLRSIEVNKLFSDTNTELRNQFVYSDKGFAEENEEGEIEETRKIESKVSRERNSFTTVSNDDINEGVDDLIEFMSPTMLHHTTEDTVKKYISDKYGEKTEIIAGKKYRLKQGETIFDIIDNSVSLTRKSTFNKILLNNSTSTILSRNSGLNINTSNYETGSNFKLFSDTNKAWINGEDGEITIGVSKDGTDNYDISINDNIAGKRAEVLMNTVIGKYNESAEDETAAGMRDTTLNGSLFVKRRFALKDKYNNKESSFDINNDEITAENYNDVELTGTSGDNKINLKFINTDGIYFERKSKDVSINKLTLKNDKSSIAYKTHEFTISDNKALLSLNDNNKISLNSKDEKLTAQAKNTQFTTDLFTIGDINSTGDLKVKGNTIIGEEINTTVLQNIKLNVIGKTIIGGDLTVSGTTSVTGRLTIDGDVDFSGLDINGTTSLNNGLEVNGKTSIGENLSVENSAEIIGSLTVGGTFLEDPDDEESTQYCALLNNGLEVKEKATLKDKLTVTGTTSVNSLSVNDGATTISGGLSVTSGGAELKNKLTVTGTTGITGNLSVAGGDTSIAGGLSVTSKGAELKNKLTVTGTTTVGTINTSGVTVTKQNLTINGATTITGETTVTSGGAELKNKLTVTGTTGITGNLSVTGTTTISGATTASRGATLKGALTVTGTTTVGATDSPQNLTINGTTTISGATTASRGATLKGALTVTGTTGITGNLSISGATTIAGGLYVTSKGAELKNKLTVTGTTGITGNLSISGATTIAGGLSVTSGGATLKDALTVTGTTSIGTTDSPQSLTINGDTIINGDFAISSDKTSLKDTLTVTGTTSIGTTDSPKDLTINGATTISGDFKIPSNKLSLNKLTVTGTTTVGIINASGTTVTPQNLIINGTTTINGDFKIASNKLSLKDTFIVTGTTSIGATDSPKDLTINGATTINGDFKISSAKLSLNKLTVTGTTSIGTTDSPKDLTINGATTVTGGLSVTSGGAELGDKLTVTGETTVGDGNNLTIGSATSTSKTEIDGGDISCLSVTTTSARSKKKNIVHSERNAVEEINKIDIVDFFYKEDVNNLDQKVGFIADDTDAIFSTRFQDKMDISNCIGMLLKAVQELSAEIKKLKS